MRAVHGKERYMRTLYGKRDRRSEVQKANDEARRKRHKITFLSVVAILLILIVAGNIIHGLFILFGYQS
jgi:hypothetical protein